MPNAERRKPTAATPRRSKRAQPIGVLLVDDHPLWRDTLRKVLERQGFAAVVAEASDGQEAVESARRSRADVIVMDIQLPEKSGIDATREIVSADPTARVLVLSSSENRKQVIEAVHAGASGYLIKTASSDEVRDAVRRVKLGEMVFPPTLASVVLEELRARGAGSGSAATPPPATDSADVAPNEFVREGDFWTVRFEGELFRLRDTRGARFLSELLHDPGREFHALELVGSGKERSGGASDAGPVLDARAKAEYRARMRHLEAELAEADGWGDVERASRVRAEIAVLEDALSAAVGLGGRDRRAASNSERARVNVTLAIKSTLSKILTYSPSLHEHLSSTVKTGTYCSYTPDPRARITWL